MRDTNRARAYIEGMERERPAMADIGQEEAAPSATATTSAASLAATYAESEQEAGRLHERRISEAASRPEATQGQEVSPIQALAMRAYRNARYHEDRQAWYDALSKWSNFLTILFGSGAFAAAIGSSEFWAAVGGAMTAIIGAAQLVFDFGVKARMHGELRRGFALIAAEAAEPHADVAKLNVAMVRLYADEPDTYHAVNALAYNAAQKAFGRPDSTLIKVSPKATRFRHWRRFEPSDFPDQAHPA